MMTPPDTNAIQVSSPLSRIAILVEIVLHKHDMSARAVAAHLNIDPSAIQVSRVNPYIYIYSLGFIFMDMHVCRVNQRWV